VRAENRDFLQRRGIPMLLTILVHVLLLLLVLLHREVIQPRKEEDRLKTFSIMPENKEKTGEKTKERTKRAEHQAAAAPPPKAKEIKPTPPKPETPSFIQMSRDDFAATDLSKLPAHGSTPDSNGTAGNSKAVAGPGQGPGGATLYEAEWYRPPSDAELSGYLPSNPPHNGWGLVACRTIENYHVDNCQQLGESPLGSGLARAVREAAWQFLVRPPRIDGRPMVGAWVRIRIDYSQRTVDGGAGN
jgi:protein TonB